MPNERSCLKAGNYLGCISICFLGEHNQVHVINKEEAGKGYCCSHHGGTELGDQIELVHEAYESNAHDKPKGRYTRVALTPALEG